MTALAMLALMAASILTAMWLYERSRAPKPVRVRASRPGAGR